MPASPRKPAAKAAHLHNLQRIRINAEGYDDTGAFWGAGPDVYIATSADGAEEITVRAKTSSEAREKITAERNRPPGSVPPAREKLGGKSPNKTRYEIEWHDAAGTACVRVRITHSRDYLAMGDDHVEVEAIAPKKAPLPITDTGYLSHFIKPLELMNAGGPVTFVTGWLEREAKAPVWRKKQAQRAQGDLFQWAEAQAATTQRKPPAKRPAKPAAKARPRPTRKDTAP